MVGKFPSPCGVLVLKFNSMHEECKEDYKEFPSPCGVLVLKCTG